MQRLRKTIVVVLLGLFVAVPCAYALDNPKTDREESSLLEIVWSFLASLWDAAGCMPDPLGGCALGEGPPPPTTDEGCMPDPLGCPEGQ